MVPLGGYVRIAGMEPGDEDELLPLALKEAAMVDRIDASTLSARLAIPRDRASSMLATLVDWGAIEPAPDDDVSYKRLVQADESTDSHELYQRVRARTYRGLSTPKRIAILAMGVTVNILTAILIFTVVLSVWGVNMPSMAISAVQEDSPAAQAGLQPGDVVTSVDGQKVGDWYELLNLLAIRPAGDTVTITWDRDGREYSSDLTFAESPDTGAAFLGISSGEIVQVDLNVWEAFLESLQWTRDTFYMILAFFNPQTFQLVAQNARSVIGVSVEAANVVKYGSAIGYAQFIALLSLSLGVMNIIPIPPLDGGKVAIEIIERIGGRPLGRKIQYGLSIAGAVLLFSLIGYLMYADVVRYFVEA
jgi:regulator of sigma E protease